MQGKLAILVLTANPLSSSFASPTISLMMIFIKEFSDLQVYISSSSQNKIKHY